MWKRKPTGLDNAKWNHNETYIRQNKYYPKNDFEEEKKNRFLLDFVQSDSLFKMSPNCWTGEGIDLKSKISIDPCLKLDELLLYIAFSKIWKSIGTSVLKNNQAALCEIKLIYHKNWY